MNKKRISELMVLANKALHGSKILNEDNTINDSYNGHTAGLGVTVAMNGLLPALVIYYQQNDEKRTTDRRQILEVIGKMINEDNFFKKNVKLNEKTEIIKGADSLIKAAINNPDNKKLKLEVIDCATALKQIIRTYKLVD